MTTSTYPGFPPLEQPLDVLVVAPHPDDAELGMGGAIAKLLKQGARVGIVDLTNGEPTPHGSPKIRAVETAIANVALGAPWRYNLGWPNRFLEPTLERRHQLAGLFRLTRPKWIFAPYWEDAHPDHVAATQIVEAARFWSKLSKSDIPGEPYHPNRIYYYFCIHLKLIPQPAFVLDISQEWSAKEASLRAYNSQLVKGRESDEPSFIERVKEEAGFWGKAIGVRFGEPFASREPIGLTDLATLV
ncbi:bacillithiol biosynthesis deacetylase BshB1 [Pirellulaceae bacterium SH449]